MAMEQDTQARFDGKVLKSYKLCRCSLYPTEIENECMETGANTFRQYAQIFRRKTLCLNMFTTIFPLLIVFRRLCLYAKLYRRLRWEEACLPALLIKVL